MRQLDDHVPSPVPAAQHRVQAWITLAALALVWGSSYILIKKSLVDFSPSQIGHFRLAIAGLAFAPIALRRVWGAGAKTWLGLFIVGLCGTGLPSFLFPFAQTQISSSLAAALSSLVPLLTLLVGVSMFGTGLRSRQVQGILIGLVAAVMLVGTRYGWASLSDGGWPLLYIGAAVLATLCYALSSNYVKAKFPDTDPLYVTAGAMAPLGVYGAIGVVALGGLPTNFAASDTLLFSYGAVVFLGLIGTALASWLFFRLVQLTEPVFASTVSYLVPIVAFMWGVLDGEAITLDTIALLALILFGVYRARK